MKKNIFKILILLLLVLTVPVSAKLYKWVDENGKVHYSDKMPPDQIKNAHQELNEQGVVKEEVGRALTDEERKAQAAILKKKREEEEKLRLQAEALEKERNKILKSYSSADQIKRLKSERVSALKRNIQMAEENLIIQKRNLDDFLKRAADRERSGQVVSDTFLEQIEQLKEQIEYQKQFIIDKNNEITETENKYDNELEKYLLFTQGTNQSVD